MLDCLFINPSNTNVYSNLSGDLSSIQPNEWLSMLANSCRNQGFNIELLDANVLGLNYKEIIDNIKLLNPRLIVFIASGNNPNSSTPAMSSAIPLAQEIKNHWPEIPICFGGPHVNALPSETLEWNCIDIVLTNEGVYSLCNLLKSNIKSDI